MSEHNPQPQNDRAQQGSAERLTSLLGFDPSKATRLTSEAFKEVVEELAKERATIAKGRAKELLGRAITLREQASDARKKFENESKRFDKELGKVIGAIQSILDGRPVQDENTDNTNS